MGCAHFLYKKYDITLFEQNDYVGGHTNTIGVDEGGKKVFMDTGFMVFNFETYPNLVKLFKEIDAPIKQTDMSFSVQDMATGLEYCGSGLDGLFAQRKNIFSPRYLKMLLEITRFNKISVKIIDDPNYQQHTLGQYIKEFGFSDDMLWKYLVPMSSAVWSTPMELMLDFPAVSLIRFFKNHGFLGLNTQHQWYTPDGGSESYKKILIAPFKNKIQTSNGAKTVWEEDGKAYVTTADGNTHVFDKVIMASHGDQSYRMLKKPSALQERILSKFRYQYNSATVHTDESIMPQSKKTWSSWNYRIEHKNGKRIPSTIYWMNRLQGVSDEVNYFVSINAFPGSVDHNKILKVIDYEHPLFDLDAMNAQKELHLLNKEGPLYFCGSYFRFGFHEDAFASAVGLCKQMGELDKEW